LQNFCNASTRELVYFLAQLYFQDAVQKKNATLAAASYEKAGTST
jgi:hypothetical protein